MESQSDFQHVLIFLVKFSHLECIARIFMHLFNKKLLTEPNLMLAIYVRMLSIVQSYALRGITPVDVTIEINAGECGDPRFIIVGLPDAAIKESCDRISSALMNSGYSAHRTKTTVNLAPSYIKKEGSFYDLPIALGVLNSTGQCNFENLSDFIIAGELGLSGKIREVKGGLIFALCAKKNKKKLLLPVESASEAAFVDGVSVFAVNNLNEAVKFLSGQLELQPLKHRDFSEELKNPKNYPNFSEVKGQFAMRRAIEVAVAGEHNLLMIGAPGSGKSMIAKCIPGIMPFLSLDEFLETMSIYSAAGLLMSEEKFSPIRPFRSPHHTISTAGLLGGGTIPLPGEISLAHNGVLFLDELAEFRRATLDSLRQPLEDGEVAISRSAGKMKFPCKAMVVGAMNPCPCGYCGDMNGRCRCSPNDIKRYMARISGPMFDRFDIQMFTYRVPIELLKSTKPVESSEAIRLRVERAIAVQQERLKNSANRRNAHMSHSEITSIGRISDRAIDLLERALTQLSISARSYDKILKVARTVADLDGDEDVLDGHILEALSFRVLDGR
jgi:magnesium chelatase family protein